MFSLRRFLIVSASWIASTKAHSRWKCPEPRSPDTGIKSGPCGDQTNDFTGDIDLEIKPGSLRIIFEESVHHTGAPFRISLSDDGSDDSSCVLLDHIPHNDCCRPNLMDETTYTPYVITIDIPNVICEKCSLHLSNPMTDKIGGDGSPNGIGCTDPGTCFSVYHSCTRPFRIAGTVEGGAIPRSEYVCDAKNEGWPQMWSGDYGESVDASTPFLYRRESSVWNEADYTLTTVPTQFIEDAGGVCGASEESNPDEELSSETNVTNEITGGGAAEENVANNAE